MRLYVLAVNILFALSEKYPMGIILSNTTFSTLSEKF